MRLIWFVIVGSMAAATHYWAVVAFVDIGHVPPALANIPAYLLALTASYAGQSRLTFVVREHSAGQFLRFALASAGGFALNTVLYAALLRWTRLDYRFALVLVIAGVAGLSFLGMRQWVFAGRPART